MSVRAHRQTLAQLSALHPGTRRALGTITAKLLDEDERLVKTVQMEDTRTYAVNDHFRAPDGGLYVVSHIAPGGAELTCVWFDGPHPASGVI